MDLVYGKILDKVTTDDIGNANLSCSFATGQSVLLRPTLEQLRHKNSVNG